VVKAITSAPTGSQAAGNESKFTYKTITKSNIVHHMTKLIEWNAINIEAPPSLLWFLPPPSPPPRFLTLPYFPALLCFLFVFSLSLCDDV